MAPIVDDRKLRWLTVTVAPDLDIRVLVAEDDDAQLEAALHDPTADPYAGILWPAAVAIAGELVGRVKPGQTVVDAGAGTGLVALTAARLGARVIALDHDPFALRLIDLAAADQRLTVETRRFDLEGTSPLPRADLVVLADLLYDPDLARAAALRAAEALQHGASVLVGDPDRVGRDVFARTLRSIGTDVVFHTTRTIMPGEPEPVPMGIAWIGARP